MDMFASSKKSKVKISVVIPTYNEGKDIGDLMECLVNQTFKDFEVIIVDNFSKDETVHVVKRYNKLLRTRIYQRKGNVSFARNFGAKKAKGEILIFLDADMIIPQDFIEKVFKSFNPDALCIYLFGTRASLFDMIHKEGESRILIAFKRKLFFKIGGFGENLSAFKDLDLAKRRFEKKLVKIVNREIIVYHKFPQSLYELYKQQKKWGEEYVKYLRKRKLYFLFPLYSCLLFVKKLFFYYGFLIGVFKGVFKE